MFIPNRVKISGKADVDHLRELQDHLLEQKETVLHRDVTVSPAGEARIHLHGREQFEAGCYAGL